MSTPCPHCGGLIEVKVEVPDHAAIVKAIRQTIRRNGGNVQVVLGSGS